MEKYSKEYKEHIKYNSIFDLAGCIIQSLNDGHGDYCYSKKQLERIKGKMRYESEGINALVVEVGANMKHNVDRYWIVIPVEIEKYIEGTKDPIKLKKMFININDISNDIYKGYRITWRFKKSSVRLKSEWEMQVIKDNLDAVIKRINKMNW